MDFNQPDHQDPSIMKSRRIRKRLSSNRNHTFYVLSRPEQHPKKKNIISEKIKGYELLNDYKGDPKNIGGVLRHLESKGIDCKKIMSRLMRSFGMFML